MIFKVPSNRIIEWLIRFNTVGRQVGIYFKPLGSWNKPLLAIGFCTINEDTDVMV